MEYQFYSKRGFLLKIWNITNNKSSETSTTFGFYFLSFLLWCSICNVTSSKINKLLCFSSFFRLTREQPVGRADSYDKTTFEIVFVRSLLSSQEKNVECTNKWMSQKEGICLKLERNHNQRIIRLFSKKPSSGYHVSNQNFLRTANTRSSHELQKLCLEKIMNQAMLIWKIIKYSNNNY